MGYQELNRLIQSGDSVSPATINTPLRTLDGNFRHLRDVLNASSLGQALILPDAAIISTLKVGQPVYWRASNNRFEAALAGIETGDDGQLQITPASEVWGILVAKANSGTRGDILVQGIIDGLDLSDAIDDEVPDGIYYLSSTTAGKLTSTATAGGVRVLRVAGSMVYVDTSLASMLTDHEHHSFSLTALPAGEHTPPAEGGTHAITSADASAPGWLPAGHASFNDLAPAGAKFGYNLAAHAALENVWPPLPLENVVLLMRHSDAPGLVGGEVPPSLVQFDENGIWWMSDCYGEVPWPTNYGNSESSSSSSSENCPTDIAMSLTLFLTRLLFSTDKTVVSSLISVDDRLIVRCQTDDAEASTGPLELLLDLEQSIEADDETGHLALKTLDPVTGKFKRGPVAEGLYTLDENVTLTSDVATSLLDPEDEDSADVHHGNVRISVNTSPTLELAVQEVRLDGVTEEYYEEVPLLGFAPAKSQALRGKVRVPADLQIGTPKLRFRFMLMGRTTGTLPALTLTYRRIPRPTDGLGTPAALPTVDTALAITTVAAVAADEYVEAQSSPVTVVAGDTIVFTLSRGAADGYAGQVGLLEQTAILASS